MSGPGGSRIERPGRRIRKLEKKMKKTLDTEEQI